MRPPDPVGSAEIRNPHPEVPPDINVAVDRLPALPTAIAGVTRKMIFDYALSQGEHRYAQMGMLPGSATPRFTTRAPLEFWVRGGDLRATAAQNMCGSAACARLDLASKGRTEVQAVGALRRAG